MFIFLLAIILFNLLSLKTLSPTKDIFFIFALGPSSNFIVKFIKLFFLLQKYQHCLHNNLYLIKIFEFFFSCLILKSLYEDLDLIKEFFLISSSNLIFLIPS